MRSNFPASRSLLFSVLFLFLLVAAAPGQTVLPSGKAAPSPAAQAAAAPSADPSKYVGAETCKTCHEEIYNGWEKSPHWKTTLNKDAGPSKQGCESCHGPGAEHVEGGGDKTKIFVFADHSRQETSARCLTCHGEGHEQAHFSESLHSSSNVGCLDCHSPHHAKEKPYLLVQNTASVVLRLPHLGQSGLRQTLSPPRERGSVAVQRLPQPAWHCDRRPAQNHAQRRRHLLQVPRRQAGPVRLRARAGQDRGLHQLPHARTAQPIPDSSG